MRRALGVVLGLGLVGAAAPASAQQAPHPELDDAELEFLDLINEYRRQSGLDELVATVTLNTASDRHSYDMASNDWFDHTGSDGSDPSERCAWAGYPDGCAENIAAGYPTARDVFDGWQSSPGHNANMLGDYAAIGIALEEGGGYGSYWTTDFGWVVDEPYVPPGDDPVEPGPDPDPDPDDPGPEPDPDPDGEPAPDPDEDPGDPAPDPLDGAGFGDLCLDGDECASRACVVLDASTGYCTRACDDQPCPYGYRCDPGASGSFCFFAGAVADPPPLAPRPMPASATGTCAAAPGRGTGSAWWIAAALVAVARRRRSSARG